MPDPEGRRIGQYVLTEQLGRGGMGVVWRARDTQLDRDVAIKMLVPHQDDSISRENSARFLVEAKAAAGIRSRHVAQVIQLGETPEKEAYIVMELLDGRTLLSVLMRERRLSPQRAVRIAKHIARGMHAAHALGVVHRDLKPANVMLVSVDGEEEVAKVLDFGVAKRVSGAGMDEKITQQGALLGTLQFMAPEQVNGGNVDARTDIYALGVLLYRMLSGSVPFEAESLAEMVRVHLTVAPRPLTDRVPGLPAALDRVIARAMEKEPAKRWQSMADFEQALAGVFETSSVIVKDIDGHTTLPPGTTLPASTSTTLPGVVPIAPMTVPHTSPTANINVAGVAPVADDTGRHIAEHVAALKEATPSRTNEMRATGDMGAGAIDGETMRRLEQSLRWQRYALPVAAGIGLVAVIALVVVIVKGNAQNAKNDALNERVATEPVAEKPVVAETKPVDDKPVVVEEKPAVVEEKPAVAEAKPAAVEETPAAVEEKPAVAETKPAVVKKKKAAPPPKKDGGFVRVHTKDQ